MEKSPFLKNFIFIFCCAVFDFTVAVSAENYSTKSWLFNIGLYCRLRCVVILLPQGNSFSKIEKLFIGLFLIFLIAKSTAAASTYMKNYNSEYTALSTVIITVITVVFFLFAGEKKSDMYIKSMFIMICIMVFVVLLSNYKKLNAINIYSRREERQTPCHIMRIFNFLVPMIILTNKREKQMAPLNIIMRLTVTALFTVFAYMAVKGNLMINMSPMAVLFTVSSGKMIRNYDAIYNFLMFFNLSAVVGIYTWAFYKLGVKKRLMMLLLPIYFAVNLISGAVIIRCEVFILFILFARGVAEK